MKVKKSLAILVLFLLSSLNAICQCTGDPSNPGTPIDEDDPPCAIPLDTWVILLVGVALIYAAYQLHKNRKELV